MEYCEELVQYILNNEKRNAELLLMKIRENSVNGKYADAREKILLIEAAKSLNFMIPAFYTDTGKLAEDLFEEKVSSKDAIDFLCEKVKDAAKEEKQAAFEKSRKFIEENLLNNQLSVSSAAEYAGISQTSLIKLFGDNLSVTPGDYIGKGRCEKSLEYLRKKASVEDAARLSGFSSVETYIRAFKKHMGMTPGIWKKKNL